MSENIVPPCHARPGVHHSWHSFPLSRSEIPVSRVRSLLILAAACAPLALSAQQLRAPRAVPTDSVFHGLAARAIGPAGTSGRVSSVEGVAGDPRILWVGAATGGLWKSTDAGYTWTAMMDTVAVGSIGVVAVNQSHPDIVWVGTGEGSARNSMGVGRGVWRSRDGGRSWSFLGLERTERIEKIILHPVDPDVAWVSALGPAWSDGTERGVFKTTDGGRTWRKVLYVDERTGAFELVADPSNPQHLLASTWEFRRWPWFFRSGGAGSGLWQTWDGGETWTKLAEKEGMPAGQLGRIGLAWAQNDPRVVYALVEAEKPALLRSDDGGVRWRAVNTSQTVTDRPFYYNRIAVDPTNENRVYRILSELTMSEDGGRTFRNIAPWSSVHVDHHSLWLVPDGRGLVVGNDGGVFISHDRGTAWRFVENLVFAQFYHIAVDTATPFNVYGGLQDNGTWMGPSEAWETPSFKGSAIATERWHQIGFGDGFAALPDPTEPGTGYSMSQGGYLRRFDTRTNEERMIRPPAPDSATRLRFNWNAGIALDPFDSRVVYYGSQFVHRSPDRGETWTIISPDLTTNDPEKQKQHESGGLTLDVTAAENHTTILTIAPSALERGLIWVGTDDGKVQLTRDGGRSWTDATARITGMPAGAWVPHVEASKHDAGTAYVVVGDHQRGDWTPRIYRTTDHGRTWRALNTAQLDGFVHVIEEDPVERNLLWAGTEFGLFVSLDAGASWKRWTQGGFPAGVPVRALVVHPRDHDLVVATHGRGVWIVDDIRPVREMARDRAIAQRPLHLFPGPTAIQHARGMRGPFYFPGDTRYQGPNRPYGALLSFWVSATAIDTTKSDSVRIEILEGDRVIRTFRAPAKAGVNRAVWGLERGGLRPANAAPDAAEPGGPAVIPGRYTARITLGANTSAAEVVVRQDPRTTRSLDAMRAGLAVQLAGDSLMHRLQTVIGRLDRTVAAIDLTEKELKRPDALAPTVRDSLVAHAGRVRTAANALLGKLRLPPTTRGIVEDRTVTSRLGEAIGLAAGADGPSVGQRQELAWRTAAAEAVLAEVARFYDGDVTALEAALRDAGFRLLGGR
jgi:photosystem II stability/assembly factor-like uncharacterized protein